MTHVRITYNEYDQIIDKCEAIKEDTHNNIIDIKKQFLQEDEIPSVENLDIDNIEERIAEYLPYLLYYSEVYEPKKTTEKDYSEFKRFIKKLLYKYLILMDDEDFIPLNKMTKEKWDKKKNKEEILAPIISYYDDDEEDIFINEMKKYSFISEKELRSEFESQKT